LENCIVLNTFDRILKVFGINQASYTSKPPPTNVPAEKNGMIFLGLTVHLTPVILFVLTVSLLNFSLGAIIISFLITSMYSLLIIRLAEKKCPIVQLKQLTKSDIYYGLSLIFITAVIFGSTFLIFSNYILSSIFPLKWQSCNWSSVILALFLTDFAYYWIHRTLNHSKNSSTIIKWYRKIHAKHHAVEALDFYRGNISTFFDTAVTGFQIPLIIISTFLGMNLETIVTTYCLVLLLQSTHHANFTFNIGPLRYLFVDNHAHKLHHCPRGYDVNFGAIFSVWDLFFRTYYEEWSLSASYLAKNKIALPLRRVIV